MSNLNFSQETPQGDSVVKLPEWTAFLRRLNSKFNHLFSTVPVANYPVRLINEAGVDQPISVTDFLLNFNGNGITYSSTLPPATNVKAYFVNVGASCAVTLVASKGDRINTATSLLVGSGTRKMLYSDGDHTWFAI